MVEFSYIFNEINIHLNFIYLQKGDTKQPDPNKLVQSQQSLDFVLVVAK